MEITGYPKNEVVGRSLVQDFITPEFQDSVQEVLQNALGGTETDNFEFPLYTKDGKCVYVLLNASSRRDNQGTIVGVVGVGQDITARKEVGDNLTVVATDLRMLIDNANAPILGTDAAGRVNEWVRWPVSMNWATAQPCPSRQALQPETHDRHGPGTHDRHGRGTHDRHSPEPTTTQLTRSRPTR